jgi:hypothetical protein
MNGEQLLVPGIVIGFADFTAPPHPPTPLTAEKTKTVQDFFKACFGKIWSLPIPKLTRMNLAKEQRQKNNQQILISQIFALVVP